MTKSVNNFRISDMQTAPKPIVAPGNGLEGGTSPKRGVVSASAHPMASGCLYGPATAPADLLTFLRERSISEVTKSLGIANGTVHRLRHGYWPHDPRKILQAWSRYKGRHGIVESSWFLRRVRQGGLVRHAGQNYTAPRLAARTGQLLAVAREAGGTLVAQTLELPAERLALDRAPSSEVAP